jgi:hypothetical protein
MKLRSVENRKRNFPFVCGLARWYDIGLIRGCMGLNCGNWDCR